MKDPLLCALDAKSKLETANGVDQLDYISSLVTDYKIENIRESQILELHKIAVHGVFGCGGTYRDALSQVTISDSEHKVPEAAFVPSHLQELLHLLNNKDSSTSALHRAAYALWRFNWIHPFRGGNGRTSRALAYLIVCIDLGAMIPGDVTVPSLIYDRRDEYVSSLRVADKGLRDTGAPNLGAMEALVKDVILQQMAMSVDSLSTPE